MEGDTVVSMIVGALVGVGAPSTLLGILFWAIKRVKWEKWAITIGDAIYNGPYRKVNGTKSEGPVVTLLNFFEKVWERIKARDAEENEVKS